MDLDRLKDGWQARDPGGATPLIATKPLMERLARLEREVQRRDVREYLAACFGITFFGWQAATTEDPLTRIGALIVVFGSMFVVVWSRRAVAPSRRQAFPGDLPVAGFLARELEKVEAQVRLSRSVWWWYVSPTIIGVLLLVAARPQPLGCRLALGVLVVAVGYVIHRMNLTTARRDLEPLRDNIRQRLEELQ